MRATDDGAGRTTADGGAVHPGEFMTALAAQPTSVAAARARLREWLDRLGWPLPDAHDVERAVGAAVAGVVGPAYPPGATGSVVLHAWVSSCPDTPRHHVTATVTRRGRPTGAAPVPAPDDGPRVRATGIAALHVLPGAAGTTVIVVGRSVPR